MKRSEELIGLSLISIEDGKEVGRVSDLVVNPEEGTVEYLIINNGLRYLGTRVLPFKKVEGVGEDAVTVQSSSSVVELGDEPDIANLLEKNVRVKGTKVLTKKGKLIGTVSEFIVDDENEGKITGCEVTPVDGSGSLGVIPSDKVITFGFDVLIISEESGGGTPPHPAGQAGSGEQKAETVTNPAAQDKPSQPVSQQAESQQQAGKQQSQAEAKAQRDEQSQAAKLFEERQREYLMGRKVSKQIDTDSGEVIAREGDPVTKELLDKAKAAGKFTELSMNTKP